MNRRDILKGSLFAPLVAIFSGSDNTQSADAQSIDAKDDKKKEQKCNYRQDYVLDTFEFSGDYEIMNMKGIGLPPDEFSRLDLELNFRHKNNPRDKLTECYSCFNPGGGAHKSLEWIYRVRKEHIIHALNTMVPDPQLSIEDMYAGILKLFNEKFRIRYVNYTCIGE